MASAFFTCHAGCVAFSVSGRSCIFLPAANRSRAASDTSFDFAIQYSFESGAGTKAPAALVSPALVSPERVRGPIRAGVAGGGIRAAAGAGVGFRRATLEASTNFDSGTAAPGWAERPIARRRAQQ